MCFHSCEEFINEINLENDQLVVIAPFDGATLTSGIIEFDWESMEGASSYRIQIARPNFQQPEQILLDETIPDSLSTNTNISLEAGIYQWRVRGQNSAYNSPYTVSNLNVN